MDEIEQVLSKRGRGKPRKTWWRILRYHMSYKGLKEDIRIVRNDWQVRIYIINPPCGIKA